MAFVYRFPVVKGIQAGKEYYIGMVPMNMLCKLFPSDEEYILPEYRAQRKLNESRLPDIKNYILNNKDTYVFSALTASIDGECRFVPSEVEDLGVLEVSMNAKFLINDGQHRKAAIIAALAEDESFGDETISIVFFSDKGLNRSQQMFTDLNKHAVKTSNSLAELYDSRDPLAVATRRVISKIEFLNLYVDKESDSLGINSPMLFTLNTFYNANKRILGRNECNEAYEEYIYDFWHTVTRHMRPWQELSNKEISKKGLREQYLATQSVIIQAIGRIGSSLYGRQRIELEQYLQRIEEINWRRTAPIWKGRIIREDGKVMTNNTAIVLAGNAIKRTIKMDLNEEEQYVESRKAPRKVRENG